MYIAYPTFFTPSQVRLTDSIESRSLNLNNLYQHNILFKAILDDATSSEAFCGRLLLFDLRACFCLVFLVCNLGLSGDPERFWMSSYQLLILFYTSICKSFFYLFLEHFLSTSFHALDILTNIYNIPLSVCFNCQLWLSVDSYNSLNTNALQSTCFSLKVSVSVRFASHEIIIILKS